jgi:RNA polymerase sigma-70 factor (ECF subfamily)
LTTPTALAAVGLDGKEPAGKAPDDETLVRAFQEEGDGEAFALLLERHAPWLSSMVLGICGGRRDEAEDALQEIALSLARNLAKFRFESGFKTWLFRLAKNKAIDSVRRSVRARKAANRFVIESIARPAGGNDPQEKALDRIAEAELWKIVDGLPPGERLLAWLRYDREESLAGIAEKLGIKEGAVKLRLHRLKRKIAAIAEG